MTSFAPWKRFQELLWIDEQLGFQLDISRMDLDDEYRNRIRAGMERSLIAMRDLEAGALANPDEERMVGHYWLRAPALAPHADLRAAIEGARDRVQRFAASIHDGSVAPPAGGKFTKFLLAGIGGSVLGPQFVADALGSTSDRLEPLFLDNTDPDGMDRVLEKAGDNLARTLVIVVSKSGGTRETRNALREVDAAYGARGLRLGPHAVAVTGEGSVLERSARDAGFLDVFPMWDWVGGRTSGFSAVGLLPAALQGIDIDGFLAGAREMDIRSRAAVLEENPAALLAAAWHRAGEGRGTRDMVVIPYKDRLLLFSRYLQQLVMESLGKETDLAGNPVHQGLVVYGNKGSTDQHAYVQQLRDGPDNFFLTFIQVLRDRGGASPMVEEDATSGDYLLGFLLGTRSALSDRGRASLTITLPEVSPRAVGALIALYERAVGLYAGLIGINAYHQPGVEAGKRAAAVVLDLQRRALAALREEPGRSWTVEEFAVRLGEDADPETLYKVLEHASANPDHGVTGSGGARPGDRRFRSGS